MDDAAILTHAIKIILISAGFPIRQGIATGCHAHSIILGNETKWILLPKHLVNTIIAEHGRKGLIGKGHGFVLNDSDPGE